MLHYTSSGRKSQAAVQDDGSCTADGMLGLPVLAVMLLIMAAVTVTQCRREGAVRAAAAGRTLRADVRARLCGLRRPRDRVLYVLLALHRVELPPAEQLRAAGRGARSGRICQAPGGHPHAAAKCPCLPSDRGSGLSKIVCFIRLGALMAPPYGILGRSAAKDPPGGGERTKIRGFLTDDSPCPRMDRGAVSDR